MANKNPQSDVDKRRSQLEKLEREIFELMRDAQTLNTHLEIALQHLERYRNGSLCASAYKVRCPLYDAIGMSNNIGSKSLSIINRITAIDEEFNPEKH